MNCRRSLLVAIAACFAFPALAQQTTSISLNLNLTTQMRPQRSTLLANRTVAPFGVVAISVDVTHPRAQGGAATGDDQGTISFVFNRLDSFDVSVDIPNAPASGPLPKTFMGNITGGKGAYKGATGSVSFNLSPDNAGNPTLQGNGSVTASGKTTSFTLSPPLPFFLSSASGDHNIFTGSGAATPIGNATVGLSLESNNAGGNDGTLTLTFNATDSISFYITFNADGPPPPNTPAVVAGGTGAYAGYTGTISITTTQAGSGLAITGSGSIAPGAAVVPTITEVSTAYGNAETAQNTFVVIKGKNLVPPDTPKDGVIWSNAPEFALDMMPTVLQGIGVKVNDKPAYVYFFCSAATDPACASDQINALTPLDDKTGQVRVTVNNNGVEGAPFVVPMRTVEPSLLVISAMGYVAAVHADGGLIGPASLFPGFSTPSKAGEPILVFAVGFGLPTTPLVPGSAMQFGPLPQLQNPPSPQCFIGSLPVTISAATLIGPGLYQFNLTVPTNAPSGDNLIYCSYVPQMAPQSFTPAGNLLTVQ